MPKFRTEVQHLEEQVLSGNKRFAVVMGSIVILQTLIIEFGGAVFETVMLDPKALLVSMGLGLLIIPVDLIRKLFVRGK